MPTPLGPGASGPPSPPLPPPTPPASPLGGLLGSRKGILTQNTLAMVTVFAIGLTVAAVLGKLAWETAFKLGVVALGIFGVQANANTIGIALEDAARLKAKTPAPLTTIDTSSSATQVNPAPALDADATLDPDKPAPPGALS